MFSGSVARGCLGPAGSGQLNAVTGPLAAVYLCYLCSVVPTGVSDSASVLQYVLGHVWYRLGRTDDRLQIRRSACRALLIPHRNE